MRVLLIDHDEDLHAAIIDAFDLAAIAVVVTQDVDDADDALDHIQVDAAIIGEITGCQDVLKVVEIVRAKAPTLPLFLLSNEPARSDFSEVLNAEIFSRPLDIPRLIESVKNLRSDTEEWL